MDIASSRTVPILLYSAVCASSMSSRPALGSTQPPIQWVPGALSLGGKAAGV
jgi:hypothetical protein